MPYYTGQGHSQRPTLSPSWAWPITKEGLSLTLLVWLLLLQK